MSVPHIVGGGSIPITTLSIEVAPRTHNAAPTAYLKPVQIDNTDLFIVGGLAVVAVAYFALHGWGK